MKLRSPLALAVVLTLGVVAVGCGKKDSDAPASTSGTAGAAATVKPPVVATTTHTPVNHDADANALRNCCNALTSEAAKQTSPGEKSKYEAAAASCIGIVNVVKSGASTRASALGSVRAALRGGALPGACN